MKNKLFKRITSITLILSVICSIFCSTILAAENDVSVDSDCVDENCSEEIFSAFSKSPFSLNENQTVTLTDSKETLLSAIKSPAVFSVKGTVTEGDTICPISERFDFSSASKFDAADWAYEAGLITEEEKIDCYCDIIINRTFVNETCLNPAIAAIEKYKTDKRVSIALGEKINAALKSPAERIEEDNDSTRGFFDQKVYNSTNFGVHYNIGNDITTSTDASNVAAYFEQLRSFFISYGFNTPIYEFLKTRYQIYLEPGPASYVDPDTGSKPGAVCSNTSSSTTSASYITIYNFTSFTNNSGAANVKLKELMAHEYFHAIQNSYNTFSNWFQEACANWAAIVASGFSTITREDIISLVGNNPIPSLSNVSYKYGAAVFPLALHASWGSSDIIRVIYETLNNYSTSITETQFQNIITEAMEAEYSNDTFAIMYRRMAAYLCNPKYWFETTSDNFLSSVWNNVKVNPNTYMLSSDPSFVGFSLGAERSIYRKFNLPSGFSGSVDVTATFNSSNGYMQLYLYNSNGSESIRLPDTVSAGTAGYQATFSIPAYMLQTGKFVVIISNTSATNSLQYSIDIELN